MASPSTDFFCESMIRAVKMSNIANIPTIQVNVYDDMLQRISEKLTEDLVTAQARQTITEIAAAKAVQVLVMTSLAEARSGAALLSANMNPTPTPTPSDPPAPPV
jgi:hypothetical protein